MAVCPAHRIEMCRCQANDIWKGPKDVVRVYPRSGLVSQGNTLLVTYNVTAPSLFGIHMLNEIVSFDLPYSDTMKQYFMVCKGGSWGIGCPVDVVGISKIRLIQRWWRSVCRMRLWQAKTLALMMGSTKNMENSLLGEIDPDILRLCSLLSCDVSERNL